MLGLIKNIFIELLTSIVSDFNYTGAFCQRFRYDSTFSYDSCKIQPALINLHPNEYNE